MTSTAGRRVGIVTIVDEVNYGNRLQNYALQRALVTLGMEPETVLNTPARMSRTLLARRAWYAARQDGLGRVTVRNARLLREHATHVPVMAAPYAHLRRDAVAEFVSRHVRMSKERFADLPPQAWRSRYDYVVVGSDQVWNHGFRNAQEIDFLTFAEPGRRIAYAASFGVHDVPTFLRSSYRRWLDGIDHLSVREQRGSELVAELTGRTVPVVLDPTMLLERRDWEEVSRLPGFMSEERYAVCFFLGRAAGEQVAWVEELARQRGVRLVNLADLHDPALAALGPGDFIGAVADADFVATDSFHTVCRNPPPPAPCHTVQRRDRLPAAHAAGTSRHTTGGHAGHRPRVCVAGLVAGRGARGRAPR